MKGVGFRVKGVWIPSLVMYQEVGQALEELSKARSIRNLGIRACIGLGGLGVFGFRRSRVVFRAGYGRASNAFGMGRRSELVECARFCASHYFDLLPPAKPSGTASPKGLRQDDILMLNTSCPLTRHVAFRLGK